MIARQASAMEYDYVESAKDLPTYALSERGEPHTYQNVDLFNFLRCFRASSPVGAYGLAGPRWVTIQRVFYFMVLPSIKLGDDRPRLLLKVAGADGSSPKGHFVPGLVSPFVHE